MTKMTEKTPDTIPNPWQALRKFTPARIALGRSGSALTTKAQLEFQLAHARARRAVHHELDCAAVAETLKFLDCETRLTCSRASSRAEYLQRPDLGRRLDEPSKSKLATKQGNNNHSYDLLFVVADGLSALAIEKNAAPFLNAVFPLLRESNLSIAPMVLAKNARVALGDEITELLGARLTIMLIGERPGLSAADSMGIYLTFGAAIGTTDEARNCISNIRPEGLAYKAAAQRLTYLINEALRLRTSGIKLKDRSTEQPGNAIPHANFLID